jgi:hypothetical protein
MMNVNGMTSWHHYKCCLAANLPQSLQDSKDGRVLLGLMPKAEKLPGEPCVECLVLESNVLLAGTLAMTATPHLGDASTNMCV